MGARGEPRGGEERGRSRGSPRPAVPHPRAGRRSPRRGCSALPGRLPAASRGQGVCGAADRAPGRPEAALAELCFPQGTGTARPPGSGRAEADLLPSARGDRPGTGGPGRSSERCHSPHTSPHHLQSVPTEAERHTPGWPASGGSHGSVLCAMGAACGRPGLRAAPTMLDGGFLHRCWVPGRRLIVRPFSCKSCA